MKRLVALLVLGLLLAGAVLVLHRAACAGLAAEQRRLETDDRAARRSQQEALARAVQAELDDLLRREAARSYDQWRPLVVPQTAFAKSLPLAPSPLTGAPLDPLIRGYLELRDGRLTGPAAAETTGPDGAPIVAPATNQAARQVLKDVAPLNDALCRIQAQGEPTAPQTEGTVDALVAQTAEDPSEALADLKREDEEATQRLQQKWEGYVDRGKSRSQRNEDLGQQGRGGQQQQQARQPAANQPPRDGLVGPQAAGAGPPRAEQRPRQADAEERTAQPPVAPEKDEMPLAVWPLRWVAEAPGPDGWPTRVVAVRRVELGGSTGPGGAGAKAWLQGFVLDVRRLRDERVPALAAGVAATELDAGELVGSGTGTLGTSPAQVGGQKLVRPELEVVPAAGAPPGAPRLAAPLDGLAVVHRGTPLDASRLLSGTRRLLDGALGLAGAVVVAGALLLLLAARAEARLAQRRADFVAAVTHELKAPLTGFRALTELLHDGLVTDEAKRQEYYASMLAESERLSRLVQNVLDASKLERGSLQVAPEPLDPGPLVADLVARFRPRLESEGFLVELALGDELPAVRADREAVAHVLGNLLDNAAKYGRGGEQVIRVELEPRGAGAAVVVTDRGPGVPEAERERVFDRFYRGQAVPRQVGGAGLGLTIARALARTQGGDLLLDAAPGGGARFTLLLPPGGGGGTT